MTHPSKTLDIVALGEAMVEFNQTKGQQPDEPPQYLQGFGGDTSNAAIAASRAGARVAYLSRLGADRWGDRLMDLWQRENVDTTTVLRDAQAPTGMYFVSHAQAGIVSVPGVNITMPRDGTVQSLVKADGVAAKGAPLATFSTSMLD
eukprot:gene32119-54545_t